MKVQTEKAGMTVKGLAQMVTASFEIETFSKNSPELVRSNLANMGGGVSPRNTSFVHTGGNGFNDDSHRDGTVAYHDFFNNHHDCETSTSPLKSIGFNDTKEEVKKMYELYEVATGGMHHSKYASSHVHITLPYMTSNDIAVKVDTKKVYKNIGLFMVKFMPLMKWLTMTNYFGARGKYNEYDRLDRDDLYYWFDNYRNQSETTCDSYLRGMGRQSYMRVHNAHALHWENRMCDQTASETHMATWIGINKAITLWAIEFARNGYQFEVSNNERQRSQDAMQQFRYEYKRIDKSYIEGLWLEMQGYLAKYLKLSNNLDALTFADKLVKNPIPEYLESKNIGEHYSPFEVEKVFNIRNRQGDTVLRNKYLHAIRSMVVPVAESLADFHENLSEHLEIEKKQAVSLYQMFKRENIDLEWLGNRLVYMGD